MSEETFIRKWAGEDHTKDEVFRDIYREVVTDLIEASEASIRSDEDQRHEKGLEQFGNPYEKLGLIKAAIRYAQELARSSRMAETRRSKAEGEFNRAADHYGRLRGRATSL